MNFVQSNKLASGGVLLHGFANRYVGTNTAEISRQFGLSGVAQLKQIHSGDVIVLNDFETHDDNKEGDALVTHLRGVGIGIRTADCVPVLMTDKGNNVAAAVHAGWRGTYIEIVSNTVKEIESVYGISPDSLTAVIGPSIKNCCYEIGEDVASQFYDNYKNADSYITATPDSKYILDLSKANKLILERSGVKEIEVLNICTKCEKAFNSYRREGKGVKTQLSFIALAK